MWHLDTNLFSINFRINGKMFICERALCGDRWLLLVSLLQLHRLIVALNRIVQKIIETRSWIWHRYVRVCTFILKYVSTYYMWVTDSEYSNWLKSNTYLRMRIKFLWSVLIYIWTYVCIMSMLTLNSKLMTILVFKLLFTLLIYVHTTYIFNSKLNESR